MIIVMIMVFTGILGALGYWAVKTDREIQERRWEMTKNSVQRDANVYVWHQMCQLAQTTGKQADKDAAESFFLKHVVGLDGK